VPEWIANQTKLRELYLSNNDLYSIEMNLANLHLSTLDLRGSIYLLKKERKREREKERKRGREEERKREREKEFH
jgi:Leucine-rich repeat (LRR) protein